MYTKLKALKQIHDRDPWSKFLETNKIRLEDLRNDHWPEEEKALAVGLNDHYLIIGVPVIRV